MDDDRGGARSLEDPRTRLGVLLEVSPDVILSVDVEGTILFVNHTVPPCTVEQIVGTNVLDWVRSDERERLRVVFERVVASGEALSTEISTERSRSWLSRLIPVKRGETVESVLVLATDVTERKRAEDALRESEARFRTLAETTSAATFMFQGPRMVYANAAAELVTGYARSELLSMSFWDVIHPDHRELVKARGLARQRGDFVPSRYEVKILTKTGEERWVDYSGTVISLDGENAVVGTAIDVTDRKRAEEERLRIEVRFQHAQKLESLGVLASGLAHDFNNLLTGILGSASLASMKVPPGSPASEQIERILVAAEKAAALTSKMLTYAGKGPFVLERVDLNALVEEVLPLVRASLGRDTSLETSLAPNLPEIDADRAQLQQVLVNLLTNASEALDGAPGEIRIRTGAMTDASLGGLGGLGGSRGMGVSPGLGPSVFLEVRDDGPGMDEETRKRAFDPFFTTKLPGRGLGLSAVEGIVRTHRGTIRVDSAPGRGTTFTVLFPSTGRSSPVEEVEAAAATRPAGPSTILVIDDEEGVRNVARATLEDCGYDVLTSSNGEEALSLFESRASDIDAVLLDVTMPGMTGEDTLEALRRWKPDVKVVLTTGLGEQEIADRFAGRALAGCLRKPFRAKELARRMAEALAEPPR